MRHDQHSTVFALSAIAKRREVPIKRVCDHLVTLGGRSRICSKLASEYFDQYKQNGNTIERKDHHPGQRLALVEF